MNGCPQFRYPMPSGSGCFGDGGAPSSKSAVAPPDERGRCSAAYDEIQQLSDGVRRALECPVCKELSGAMFTCCDNGHGLCDDCSYTMNRLHPQTPPKCPLCRSPPARLDDDGCTPPTTDAYGDEPHDPRTTVAVQAVPEPASARKLNEIMSVVKVTCAYRLNGCPYLLYVLSAATHEALCPHAPHVRCMVPGCQWSGAYGDTFHHVSTNHLFSAYDVLVNQFLMPDLTFGLQGPIRRAYLTRNVQDSGRLYWVCVAQPSMEAIQVAVLKVFDPDAHTKFTSGPPGMEFRVKTMGRKGWPKQRGRSRYVCWDRMVLDRMARVLAGYEYQEKSIAALHTPPWCTVTVRDHMQYEAIITWSTVHH